MDTVRGCVLLTLLCGLDIDAVVFDVAQERASRRGTFFFHIGDGFQYHKNGEDEGTYYFKCVQYERTPSCRGRAVLDPVEGFIHTLPHIHEADLHYPDEMALRNSIIDRCEALDYAPYNRILQEESAP